MTLPGKSLSLLPFIYTLLTGSALAAGSGGQTLDLTGHFIGYFALLIFIVAYLLVMMEEFTHMRKSKPVMLAAGIIWAGIAWVYATHDLPHAAEQAIRQKVTFE